MKSLVITVSAADQDDANRIAVALGHDAAPLPGQSFVVGFSSDGSAPATHFSARMQVQDSFLALLSGAVGGSVPDEPPAGGSWEDYGLTPERVVEVSQALQFDVRTEGQLADLGWSYADHFREANAGWGLLPVTADEG